MSKITVEKMYVTYHNEKKKLRMWSGKSAQNAQKRRKQGAVA